MTISKKVAPVPFKTSSKDRSMIFIKVNLSKKSIDPIGFEDGPNPFLYQDPYGLFISDFFKGFTSAGLQAVGLRLAIIGVGIACPPAAVAFNTAVTCYGVYSLATFGVSVGFYVVNSTLEDGLQGTSSALYNIAHSCTDSGFLGGVVGSMASGKVKFNKSIRATHGGLVLDTTSKTNSFVKNHFLRSSDKLEKYFVRNSNQINHIMQEKHAWDKLMPLTKNEEKDFAKVLQLLEDNKIFLEKYRKNITIRPEFIRYDHQMQINGFEVKAVFNKNPETGKIFLNDAWVITK